MKRQNIQPDALAKRVVGGHVLYSHVVVVEAKKTIFVSDISGREINEKDSAKVTITYGDARRGQIVLDVNASEVAVLMQWIVLENCGTPIAVSGTNGNAAPMEPSTAGLVIGFIWNAAS